VGSQTSDGKRELSSSIYIKSPSWYEMKLMYAKEHEAYRNTLREIRPSTKFSNFMASICSVIDFVTSKV
jgi:hypothetical protein